MWVAAEPQAQDLKASYPVQDSVHASWLQACREQSIGMCQRPGAWHTYERDLGSQQPDLT